MKDYHVVRYRESVGGKLQTVGYAVFRKNKRWSGTKISRAKARLIVKLLNGELR